MLSGQNSGSDSLYNHESGGTEAPNILLEFFIPPPSNGRRWYPKDIEKQDRHLNRRWHYLCDCQINRKVGDDGHVAGERQVFLDFLCTLLCSTSSTSSHSGIFVFGSFTSIEPLFRDTSIVSCALSHSHALTIIKGVLVYPSPRSLSTTYRCKLV